MTFELWRSENLRFTLILQLHLNLVEDKREMGDSNGASSGGAADSYIGSLISLTSKSEIRYEGILYTVDTANSNIALQDGTPFPSVYSSF